MSHWVTYKNDILVDTNINYLRSALKEMDLEIDCKRQKIENTWGDSFVDYALIRNHEKLPLGFNSSKNEDGKNVLELVGDFFGTGLREISFMDNLAKYYQKARISDILIKNNWSIESIENTKDDEIVINACEYVLA